MRAIQHHRGCVHWFGSHREGVHRRHPAPDRVARPHPDKGEFDDSRANGQGRLPAGYVQQIARIGTRQGDGNGHIPVVVHGHPVLGAEATPGLPRHQLGRRLVERQKLENALGRNSLLRMFTGEHLNRERKLAGRNLSGPRRPELHRSSGVLSREE
jgi:hypothetical protein